MTNGKRNTYGIKLKRYGSHYESDGEQWGSWHKDGGDLRLISLVDEGSEAVQTVNNIKLEAGKSYFLVYIMYSSGDTFGRSTNNFEPMVVTDDYEVAARLKKAIEENKEYTFKFEDLEISAYNYLGYFEHLESCDIEKLVYMP